MLFNYTTELKSFFEQNSSKYQPPLSNKETIEAGRKKLFDFDYPLFDPDYKAVFETHFIRHFYLRQIGFETFGLFKFQLETWLLINMPYYNKVFESELLDYNPLTNSSMKTTSKKENEKNQNDTKNMSDTKTINGQTTGTSNRNASTENKQNSSTMGSSEGTQAKEENSLVVDDDFNRQLESNNPDSRLALTANDGEGVIEYASQIKEQNQNNSKTSDVTGTTTTNDSSQVESEATSLGTTKDLVIDNSNSQINQNDEAEEQLTRTINDVEEYVQERVGKIGVQSYAKLLQEYRGALIRVEKQIFNEMNELFMMIY